MPRRFPPPRLFRPDEPVRTFGLVPPATCTGYAVAPTIALAVAILFVAAVISGSLP